MLRQRLIRFSLEALAATRAQRWMGWPPDAAGFVLTLHHVRPAEPAAFAPNAHLSITPEYLDALLARLGAAGMRFVPVEELVSRKAAAGAPARRVAITLDDGFRDNLEHAWPVFRRHSAPFTIFVCPGFCDATAELWWEALERIIGGAEALSLDGAGPGETPVRSVGEKSRAFAAWAKWLTTDADEARQREAIRKLSGKYGLDPPALARALIMNWDEVRRIAADPLCSIGAHTMTHPALARISAPAAFAEMRESADRIEAEIGKRPQTIAFPYGYATAASAREAALADQAGFAASFTTRPGYVPREGSRQGLPRISVNGLYQDPRLLEALLNPSLWKLKNWIRMRG